MHEFDGLSQCRLGLSVESEMSERGAEVVEVKGLLRRLPHGALELLVGCAVL